MNLTFKKVNSPENRLMMKLILKVSGKERALELLQEFLKTRVPSYKLEVFETEVIWMINDIYNKMQRDSQEIGK